MQITAHELTAVIAGAEPRLREVGDEEAARPVLEGGWSRKQVIGHLIDSASNNHQRFVRAALAGSLEWPGYDQNGCVRIEAFQGARWALLIEIWVALNRLLVHVLAHLPPESGEVNCRIGENPPMLLRELARDYLRHLRHHLEQIGIA